MSNELAIEITLDDPLDLTIADSVEDTEDAEDVEDTKTTSTANEVVGHIPALLELAASIQTELDSINLQEVYAKTITRVDNNNRSVILINKYLLLTGRECIPIIAPALAPFTLSIIESVSKVEQGDIILYADKDNQASLGILMSSTYSNIENKVLTTTGDMVTTVSISNKQVKQIMR